MIAIFRGKKSSQNPKRMTCGIEPLIESFPIFFKPDLREKCGAKIGMQIYLIYQSTSGFIVFLTKFENTQSRNH